MLQLPPLVSARRLVGRLVSNSYHFAKWRSHFDYRESLKKEPLLVYQMGKVGSATIRSSLEASPEVQSRYSIYHVHFLGLERLLYEENLYKKAAKRYTGDPATVVEKFPGYVWSGQYLAKSIRSQSEKRQWTVITLVREPISRNVSSFFYNLDFLLSYNFRSRLESMGKEAVLEDLKSLFRKSVLEKGALERFDANPLTWFDSELKFVFGIDVYSTRFPADKGYCTYAGPRVRVLL